MAGKRKSYEDNEEQEDCHGPKTRKTNHRRQKISSDNLKELTLPNIVKAFCCVDAPSSGSYNAYNPEDFVFSVIEYTSGLPVRFWKNIFINKMDVGEGGLDGIISLLKTKLYLRTNNKMESKSRLLNKYVLKLLVPVKGDAGLLNLTSALICKLYAAKFPGRPGHRQRAHDLGDDLVQRYKDHVSNCPNEIMWNCRLVLDDDTFKRTEFPYAQNDNTTRRQDRLVNEETDDDEGTEIQNLPDDPVPTRPLGRGAPLSYTTDYNECLEEEYTNIRTILTRLDNYKKEIKRAQRDLAQSHVKCEQLMERRLEELMHKYILAQFHIVNPQDGTFKEDMVYSIRALGALRMRWDQLPGRKSTYVEYLQGEFGNYLLDCNIPDFQADGPPPIPTEEDVIRQAKVVQVNEPNANFDVNLVSEDENDEENEEDEEEEYDANVAVARAEKEKEEREAKEKELQAKNGTPTTLARAGHKKIILPPKKSFQEQIIDGTVARDEAAELKRKKEMQILEQKKYLAKLQRQKELAELQEQKRLDALQRQKERAELEEQKRLDELKQQQDLVDLHRQNELEAIQRKKELAALQRQQDAKITRLERFNPWGELITLPESTSPVACHSYSTNVTHFEFPQMDTELPGLPDLFPLPPLSTDTLGSTNPVETSSVQPMCTTTTRIEVIGEAAEVDNVNPFKEAAETLTTVIEEEFIVNTVVEETPYPLQQTTESSAGPSNETAAGPSDPLVDVGSLPPEIMSGEDDSERGRAVEEPILPSETISVRGTSRNKRGLAPGTPKRIQPKRNAPVSIPE